MDDAEKTVREFYDNYGWIKDRGRRSGEDALYREFSPPYYPYHARVGARTLQCFDGLTGKLLMAGGGDLPETHVAIANKFQTTCLDISKVAIDIARRKLAGNGEFVVGSILDIPWDDNSFDAAYCAHVIYHIDRDQQATAVRELIRVTKPGGRIVVIYMNPDSLANRALKLKRNTPLLWKLRRKNSQSVHQSDAPPLYSFTHPLGWWDQFRDRCEINIQPWDLMSTMHEENLLINNSIARIVYGAAAWFDTRYSATAVRLWHYPLLTLSKKHISI